MATTPADEQLSPSSHRERSLVIVFWLMLGVALWSWSLSWNKPILDRHEFRQLQTALSTFWIKQDGYRLNYETPLFGPPSWSIPMEFPVYQWCTAQFSRFTGLPLDQSGRATSILFLLGTLPAVAGLAGLAGLSRPGRLLTAAAVLSSPVYLFYGRTFMIETTALCFSVWFVFAIGRGVRDLSLRWGVVAAICATLAALAKVTTFAVYCFPAAGLALWLGWPQWSARREATSRPARAALIAAGPVIVAAVFGWWWIKHADAVKDANPFSGFLKSSEMVSWNWGTLDQRWSATVWSTVWSNVAQFVLAEPAFAVLAVCAALVTRRLRVIALASAAAFLLGPLLFANLYFRHDYYYSANALLLMFSAGLLLAGIWQSAILPPGAKVAILAVFFGSQLLAFDRGYAFNHRRVLPEPPGIARVIRETVPADGVVLIYGWDWDSCVPYYAQRRVIMVPDGRDNELRVLEDVLAQLPPRRIAGLLVRQRPNAPIPEAFIRERINRFGLASTPVATSTDGDFYLPADRAVAALVKLNDRSFPQVTLGGIATAAPSLPDTLKDTDLGPLDLSMISPRPVKARSLFGLSIGETNGHKVLFAHPVSELYFVPPVGAAHIEAEVGIMDNAYASGAAAVTDGVDVRIIELPASGQRRVLYQRNLDPAKIPGDRGPQPIALDPGVLTGTIVFEITPGPKNNLVNDWAYWSRITLR
jgi:Dolichyl-phosphate-mannose-protein mannosyltransferase